MYGGVLVVFGVQCQVLLPQGTLTPVRPAGWFPAVPSLQQGLGGGSPFSLKVKW